MELVLEATDIMEGLMFHEFGGNLQDSSVENSRSYCVWYAMSLTCFYIQLFGPQRVLLFQNIQETLGTVTFPEEMNMMSLAYISLGSRPLVWLSACRLPQSEESPPSIHSHHAASVMFLYNYMV